MPNHWYLQQREIERVIRLEAQGLGIQEIEIEVRQDAKRGLLAQINACGRQDELAASLGRYSFQIEWL